MVPMSRRAVLAKIHMNMRALAQLVSPHGTMAYCFALGGRGHAFARGMLPWGTIEDPATGSAGGSLGAYLVQHGQLRAGEQLKSRRAWKWGGPAKFTWK